MPSELSLLLRDRYTIERELGRGGMATVYLAIDLKHKRPVALKVLRPELAGELCRRDQDAQDLHGDLEGEECDPRLSTIVRIVQGLDVSLGEFFTAMENDAV
jgi:serine/threonine protein kinase